MKPIAIFRTRRGKLAGAVLGAVTAAVFPCQADVITLYPEADSVVDELVNFPYQGNNANLWVSYDTVWNARARSYLRFSLAGVNTAERIVSARLNLYAEYILSGGNVDLYRSANDTWPENAINFGNQPGWSGARLDTLFINSIGTKSFELLRLGNWDPLPDIADGKVTLAITTREVAGQDSLVRFWSRTGATPPTLVLTTRGRGTMDNSGFEDGLTGFNTTGNVTVVADPGNPSNHSALLQTASPASVWQTIDAPNTLFTIGFDADFLTDTGTFTITLGDTVLLSVTAPAGIPGGVDVPDRSLIGKNDLDLKFTLDGPEGVTSKLVLDNIELFSVPDPPLMIRPGETDGSVTLSFFADDTFPWVEGGAFQIESSTDGVSWSEHGRQIGDLGMTYEETVPATNGVQFFRLKIFPYREAFDVEAPNWEFELPVLGDDANTTSVPNWASTGGAGVWNPPATVYPDYMFDGENVAYVHDGHSLSQTLTNVLEPYRTYRLDALVGKRPDITFPTITPPNLILRAGGVALVPDEVDSPDPAAGTFELWLRTYRIGKDHPQLSQPLEIVLDGGTSGPVSQVNFDSVLIGIK